MHRPNYFMERHKPSVKGRFGPRRRLPEGGGIRPPLQLASLGQGKSYPDAATRVLSRTGGGRSQASVDEADVHEERVGPKQAEDGFMALVKILVDGHRLLQSWDQVAPGKARRTTSSRVELINQLTRYYDAEGIPLIVIFDGVDPDDEELQSTQEVEVEYAKRGQTADQCMMRLSDRYRKYGTVLLVTDAGVDQAPAPHREVQSCADFIQQAEQSLRDLAQNISRFNQENDSQYQRNRSS